MQRTVYNIDPVLSADSLLVPRMAVKAFASKFPYYLTVTEISRTCLMIKEMGYPHALITH